MDTIKNYIRVATEYYKIVDYPLISGDTIRLLRKWNRSTIIDDFGIEKLKKIKKYEGFCIQPSHELYEPEINNFYNQYQPLSFEIKEGKCDKIFLFLKHIFEEHYTLALDYLTILWRYPTQILPILCLVSSERNTGKTTFIKLLKHIFEGNMIINKNEDFRSRFNSDWASKLIIAVDEVLLDKKEDSESIKNLSTSTYFKSESKGLDKSEIEFFGKFILCSNNEDNFINMDKLEIRFWVRKIKPFEKENPDLLNQMKEEVAAFAWFLTKREIVFKRETRMWFTKEQIFTEALENLIKGNKSNVEKEIEVFLSEQFEILNVDELNYTISDLIEQLNKGNIRISKSYLSKILVEKYNLQPKNSSYIHYSFDSFTLNDNYNIITENKKGRFYTFSRKIFYKNC